MLFYSCIGHGKQSCVLLPSRVHRLRQVSNVSCSGTHTIALQQFRVPISLCDPNLGHIYEDDTAVVGVYALRDKNSLLRKCEEMLVRRVAKNAAITGNITDILEMFALGFRLHMTRVVKWCIRYIFLNQNALIPVVLKTLPTDQLQQLDYYYHKWSHSEPSSCNELDSHINITQAQASFPSYMHPDGCVQHSQSQPQFTATAKKLQQNDDTKRYSRYESSKVR